MRRLVFSLLLFAAAACADFDARQWRFRMLVSAPNGLVSEFVVTPEVFRHSSSQLTDLRIIQGALEIPYVVNALSGDVQQKEFPVEILNKAWTQGKGVQAVLDLKGHAAHNRLRISTAERNFKQAVVVETSDDGKQWSTVQTGGVIFDISRPESKVSDLTVTYPESSRRYVRVTIPGWADAAFLESAWLAEYQESKATRNTLATLTPTIQNHPKEQRTDFVFDLGFAGQPFDRLVLNVKPGLFSRMVAVSTSPDLKVWNGKGGGWLDRMGDGEHLTLELNESWDRYIQVAIYNLDSAPLNVVSAVVSGIRRVVRFPGAGNAWLYLGEAAARNPQYDFGRVDDPARKAATATLGVAEANPAFEPPQAPYSERKPWVLNGILGIAVLVMAWITWRFAKRALLAK